MAEDIHINKGLTREETYWEIIPQIKSLIEGENDIIANLANIAAVLREAFDFFWIGFYIVKENELVLGPFQGPVACTRIQQGKGVCGKAWQEKKAIIVPDVNQFPGHIACSSLSKSEIVVPVLKNNEVHLILDIDSDKLDDFSDLDLKHLMKLAALIEELIL